MSLLHIQQMDGQSYFAIIVQGYSLKYINPGYWHCWLLQAKVDSPSFAANEQSSTLWNCVAQTCQKLCPQSEQQEEWESHICTSLKFSTHGSCVSNWQHDGFIIIPTKNVWKNFLYWYSSVPPFITLPGGKFGGRRGGQSELLVRTGPVL